MVWDIAKSIGNYIERKGHITGELSESAKMTGTCHTIKLLGVPENQEEKPGFGGTGPIRVHTDRGLCRCMMKSVSEEGPSITCV